MDAQDIKPKPLPRLSQCFLCDRWDMDKDLILIEVPDQTGWVEKKACQVCLGKIKRGY